MHRARCFLSRREVKSGGDGVDCWAGVLRRRRRRSGGTGRSTCLSVWVDAKELQEEPVNPRWQVVSFAVDTAMSSCYYYMPA
jgi:hypothetical protein